MTVSHIRIEPHGSIKNWFRVTLFSRKDGIGETKIELLCSEETLRMICLQVDKTLKENGND